MAQQGEKERAGPRLKFCPENDLMQPRANPERGRLEYYCQHCGHTEDADQLCIMRTEYIQSTKDRTMVLTDMVSDPTLPVSRGTECPRCKHNEAVYQAKPTIRGMRLQYQCTSCGNLWASDS